MMAVVIDPGSIAPRDAIEIECAAPDAGISCKVARLEPLVCIKG